jgi:hypothetical protein
MGISWKEPEYVCLQCGGAIAEVLARLGSILCHDCRDEQGVDAIVVRTPPKHRRPADASGQDDEGHASRRTEFIVSGLLQPPRQGPRAGDERA